MHHRHVDADGDGKERVDVHAPSPRDNSTGRGNAVSFQVTFLPGVAICSPQLS